MATRKKKYFLPKRPQKTRFYSYVIPGLKRNNGQGYVRNTISKSEKRWLDKLGVPMRGVPIRGFNGKIFVVDGYDPRSQTVFEFNGCAFHGHYTHIDLNKVFTKTKVLQRTQYLNTIQRFQTLYDFGFKVFFVWECEFKKGHLGRYYNGQGDYL